MMDPRDRAGSTLDFVMGKGPVSASFLKTSLKDVLDSDALLVSDGNPAYRSFCISEGISHESLNLR